MPAGVGAILFMLSACMKIYLQHHYIMYAGQEEAVVTALSVRDFYNYVIASRSDGMKDLQLFAEDRSVLENSVSGLQELDLQFVGETEYDEAKMLALYNPQSPIAFTDDLTIFPEKPPADVTGLALHVPAGPAFGDGRHPTTQMLAAYLMKMDCTDKRCLDLGCGTGVLGLIAHKRGALTVDFTDVDDDSVSFTKDVCALNDYPQAKVWNSNLLEACSETYDVLIANIYADLLLDVLSDPNLHTVLPQGTALLSGISYKRIDDVLNAAEKAGLHVQEQQEQAWWHSLVLVR